MRACGWNMNQSKAEYPNIPNNVRMRMAHYSYIYCLPLWASQVVTHCLPLWASQSVFLFGLRFRGSKEMLLWYTAMNGLFAKLGGLSPQRAQIVDE